MSVPNFLKANLAKQTGMRRRMQSRREREREKERERERETARSRTQPQISLPLDKLRYRRTKNMICGSRKQKEN